MEPRIPSLGEYDFVLVLTGVTELTSGAEDALFEAGCDDATISIRSGRVFLTFSRAAASLREAVISAVRDVKRAQIGADVLRVDDYNLVTQAEIARKIGRTRQLVHQFISGARGPGGFPAPSCHITDSVPLWRWCEVAYWLWQNDMLNEAAFHAAQDVDLINSVLEFAHQRRLHPDFVDQFFPDLQSSIKGASGEFASVATGPAPKKKSLQRRPAGKKAAKSETPKARAPSGKLTHLAEKPEPAQERPAAKRAAKSETPQPQASFLGLGARKLKRSRRSQPD